LFVSTVFYLLARTDSFHETGARTRIPLGAKYLYLLQNVQTGSGAHPASDFMGNGLLSQG